MGIFSLFGKKDSEQKKTAEQGTARGKTSSAPSTRRTEGTKSGERQAVMRRDARTARDTALKIDAIESEMSSEFVNATTMQPIPGKQGSRSSSAPATPSRQRSHAPPSSKDNRSKPIAEPRATLQPLATTNGATTDFLLYGNSTVNDVASPSAEAAAVIEESAIMYANGQSELVEQMLRSAISDGLLGDVTPTAWCMLFDLYQLCGKRDAFELLAVEYVNKFETSPPGWIEMEAPEHAPATPAGTVPTVSLSGKLDASTIRHTERIKKLAETHRALRLELARVTQVDQEGCEHLLATLKQLQKSGHELVLVGARELSEKIRAIIQTGRRDEGEDCWLLLLEILRLLNAESEFEETSIDYCVTFEVSPPMFVAPQASVTTAVAELATLVAEGYAMPALVEGRVDNLILAIAAYSDEHCPAIIDCSRLIRVDFTAAGRLLTGLAPFCGSGKIIEFHHVNHLVAELFNVIGLKDIVRVVPRKS